MNANEDERQEVGSGRPALDRRDAQREDPLSSEVASEGGTPGDLEIDRGRGPGSGSEATEVWQSEKIDIDEIHRDETGRGRRSPVE